MGKGLSGSRIGKYTTALSLLGRATRHIFAASFHTATWRIRKNARSGTFETHLEVVVLVFRCKI